MRNRGLREDEGLNFGHAELTVFETWTWSSEERSGLDRDFWEPRHMVAFGAMGRDEILIEKVQRERRGGPRPGLERMPTFKGHVEKPQPVKELQEEGAEAGGAMTLNLESQSPCRESHRRLWMTTSSAAEGSGKTRMKAHPLGLAT